MPISDEDKHMYKKAAMKRIQNLEENKKEQNIGFNSQEQMKKLKDDKTFKRLFHHLLQKTKKEEQILEKIEKLTKKKTTKKATEETIKNKLTKKEQELKAIEAQKNLKASKKKKYDKISQKLSKDSQNPEVSQELMKKFRNKNRNTANMLALKYLSPDLLQKYQLKPQKKLPRKKLQ
jgi:hypothetical protein